MADEVDAVDGNGKRAAGRAPARDSKKKKVEQAIHVVLVNELTRGKPKDGSELTITTSEVLRLSFQPDGSSYPQTAAEANTLITERLSGMLASYETEVEGGDDDGGANTALFASATSRGKPAFKSVSPLQPDEPLMFHVQTGASSQSVLTSTVYVVRIKGKGGGGAGRVSAAAVSAGGGGGKSEGKVRKHERMRAIQAVVQQHAQEKWSSYHFTASTLAAIVARAHETLDADATVEEIADTDLGDWDDLVTKIVWTQQSPKPRLASVVAADAAAAAGASAAGGAGRAVSGAGAAVELLSAVSGLTAALAARVPTPPSSAQPSSESSRSASIDLSHAPITMAAFVELMGPAAAEYRSVIDILKNKGVHDTTGLLQVEADDWMEMNISKYTGKALIAMAKKLGFA